jgi:hypothetical protein
VDDPQVQMAKKLHAEERFGAKHLPDWLSMK